MEVVFYVFLSMNKSIYCFQQQNVKVKLSD